MDFFTKVIFIIGLVGGWMAFIFAGWLVGCGIADKIKARMKRIPDIEKRLKNLEQP